MNEAPVTRSVPELSAAGALAIVDAAVGEAGRLGVAVVVAISDRAGNPLALLRMDGAPLFSVDVARKKAWTAAASGLRTEALRDVFLGDPTLLHGLTPKVEMLMAVGGGTPIVSDGVVAGAVGISGATEEQDQEIADAAASVV